MVTCPEPHDVTWDGKPTAKECIEPMEAVALTLSRTSPMALGELSQQLLLPRFGVLTWRAGQPPRTPAKGRRANTSKVFSVGLELAKHRINISNGLAGPRRALSSHILSASGQQGKALCIAPLLCVSSDTSYLLSCVLKCSELGKWYRVRDPSGAF